MGRLDWKRGRFDSDFETKEIHHGLRGHQASRIGDTVDYWRFDREDTVFHDVYDEGFGGAGRLWRPPVEVPALHVTHDEGDEQGRSEGFYFVDSIFVTCSFAQFTRTGLTESDIKHQAYMRDRIVYDGRVFTVNRISILGQIQQKDIIVSIEATHLKPDELDQDSQFLQYKS